MYCGNCMHDYFVCVNVVILLIATAIQHATPVVTVYGLLAILCTV